MLTGQVTNAGVSDSLGLGSIAAFLGLAAPDSVRTDYGGTLVERVNYLEQQNKKLTEQNESLAAQMAELTAKTDNLATKEQVKDLATKEDVENVSKAANASYNLYVYIPKNIATGNYDGQKVTITSSSGNQNSSATLRDDGVNYSTTLYFNFNGNCSLHYNGIFSNQPYTTTRNIVINATGQEQVLLARNSLDFVHAVCSAGIANQYFGVGNVLENGWTVVNAQAGALQLWRKTSLGRMDWGTANSIANNYWQTFNAENNTNVAYSSGLLSEAELKTDWLCNNRLTGFRYWTSNPWGVGAYEIVRDDGQFDFGYERNDNGCLPYVWIY